MKKFVVKFTRSIHDDIEQIFDLMENNTLKEHVFGSLSLGYLSMQLCAIIQFNKELREAVKDFKINHFEFKEIKFDDDEISIYANIELQRELDPDKFIEEIQAIFYDGYAGMTGNFVVENYY